MQRSLPEQVASFHRIAVGEGLRIGAAQRDITPWPAGADADAPEPRPWRDPQYLGGFDPARTATGVVSPLAVRAMVFELGGETFAILGLDNLGLMREDVDWIKAGLGLAPGNVLRRGARLRPQRDRGARGGCAAL